MNWTFLITLLILIICTVVGAFRGLIKTVYSLIIIVAVTVLTTIFAPKLTTYLKNNTTWDDALQSKTESFLRDRGILSDSRQIDLDELPVPDSIKIRYPAELRITAAKQRKYIIILLWKRCRE